MRLFIAIELPLNVQDYLRTLQKKLTGQLTFVKSFHLTLKFLGEVTPQTTELVKKHLQSITFNPINAHLTSLGTFPNNKNPRVIWTSVEPHDAICTLQQHIDSTLKPLFPPEKNFKPHITLARVKKIENTNFLNQPIEKPPFTITTFSLIESKLTKEGSTYNTIQEYVSHQ